jgi:phosphoglycerate dehydrogenase-like enzyme
MAALTVAVPDEQLAEALSGVPGPAAEVVVWDLTGPPPRPSFDLVVVPYMSPPSLLEGLAGVRVRVVQSQMLGYDGVAEALPAGATYCNAVGIHEASTAELAVGLIIASQRRLPAFVRAQAARSWSHAGTRALADSHVVVLGSGGVGRAIADRLRPFEVELTRAARTTRVEGDETVVGMDGLGELLPRADVVTLALPLTPETAGLVDAAFLDRMRPGSLLVNVGRGGLVVTEDLVAAVRAGRVRAALDVVDPEPLPDDHPLWTLDEVLLTPHIGGHSAAMRPRVERLVRRQLERLASGEPPLNVVFGPADGPA